jgi:hypothetical protein
MSIEEQADRLLERMVKQVRQNQELTRGSVFEREEDVIEMLNFNGK